MKKKHFKKRIDSIDRVFDQNKTEDISKSKRNSRKLKLDTSEYHKPKRNSKKHRLHIWKSFKSKKNFKKRRSDVWKPYIYKFKRNFKKHKKLIFKNRKNINRILAENEIENAILHLTRNDNKPRLFNRKRTAINLLKSKAKFEQEENNSWKKYPEKRNISFGDMQTQTSAMHEQEGSMHEQEENNSWKEYPEKRNISFGDMQTQTSAMHEQEGSMHEQEENNSWKEYPEKRNISFGDMQTQTSAMHEQEGSMHEQEENNSWKEYPEKRNISFGDMQTQTSAMHEQEGSMHEQEENNSWKEYPEKRNISFGDMQMQLNVMHKQEVNNSWREHLGKKKQNRRKYFDINRFRFFVEDNFFLLKDIQCFLPKTNSRENHELTLFLETANRDAVSIQNFYVLLMSNLDLTISVKSIEDFFEYMKNVFLWEKYLGDQFDFLKSKKALSKDISNFYNRSRNCVHELMEYLNENKDEFLKYAIDCCNPTDKEEIKKIIESDGRQNKFDEDSNLVVDYDIQDVIGERDFSLDYTERNFAVEMLRDFRSFVENNFISSAKLLKHFFFLTQNNDAIGSLVVNDFIINMSKISNRMHDFYNKIIPILSFFINNTNISDNIIIEKIVDFMNFINIALITVNELEECVYSLDDDNLIQVFKPSCDQYKRCVYELVHLLYENKDVFIKSIINCGSEGVNKTIINTKFQSTINILEEHFIKPEQASSERKKQTFKSASLKHDHPNIPKSFCVNRENFRNSPDGSKLSRDFENSAHDDWDDEYLTLPSSLKHDHPNIPKGFCVNRENFRNSPDGSKLSRDFENSAHDDWDDEYLTLPSSLKHDHPNIPKGFCVNRENFRNSPDGSKLSRDFENSAHDDWDDEYLTLPSSLKHDHPNIPKGFCVNRENFRNSPSTNMHFYSVDKKLSLNVNKYNK